MPEREGRDGDDVRSGLAALLCLTFDPGAPGEAQLSPLFLLSPSISV